METKSSLRSRSKSIDITSWTVWRKYKSSSAFIRMVLNVWSSPFFTYLYSTKIVQIVLDFVDLLLHDFEKINSTCQCTKEFNEVIRSKYTIAILCCILLHSVWNSWNQWMNSTWKSWSKISSSNSIFNDVFKTFSHSFFVIVLDWSLSPNRRQLRIQLIQRKSIQQNRTQKMSYLLSRIIWHRCFSG